MGRRRHYPHLACVEVFSCSKHLMLERRNPLGNKKKKRPLRTPGLRGLCAAKRENTCAWAICPRETVYRLFLFVSRGSRIAPWRLASTRPIHP